MSVYHWMLKQTKKQKMDEWATGHKNIQYTLRL